MDLRVSHVSARVMSAEFCGICGRYVRRRAIGVFLTGRKYKILGLNPNMILAVDIDGYLAGDWSLP